jgi:hypothetical protein
MAKATPVNFGGVGGRNLGTFYCEEFNLFEQGDREAYAELRNRMNDLSEGIKVDMIKEYSRKKTITETMEGGSNISTTTEEIILLVHYWAKTPSRTRGDSDEDDEEDRRRIAPAG